MPTRTEWRTGFMVGLFLFGPGLRNYLSQQAEIQTDPTHRAFYRGLARIVHDTGSDPEKALKLADRLYDEIWGPRRKRAARRPARE